MSEGRRRRYARNIARSRAWVEPGIWRNTGAIVITVCGAMLLTLLPWPLWMQNFAPKWMTLAVFYWCTANPQRFGVGFGWCIGMLMDLLHYTLFGHHALIMTLVAAVAVGFHHRIRMYYLWQQCVLVFALCLFENIATFWIFNQTGEIGFRLGALSSALTSALMWPFVYTLLRFMRQRSGGMAA